MAFPDSPIEDDVTKTHTAEIYLQRCAYLLNNLALGGGGGGDASAANQVLEISELQTIVSDLAILIYKFRDRNVDITVSEVTIAGNVLAGKRSISIFSKTGVADWTVDGIAVSPAFKFSASVSGDHDSLTQLSYDPNGNTLVIVTTEVV